ncbi:MAG: adenylate kinase [Deltaproteobacteria bacterium]|nr:adenylate kinase [Deltaproteobacteria bacterium]
MFIVILGPPGAGKGTQAARIARSLRIPQVATGDMFRKHLGEGTELGWLARSFMDAGALVPDEVVCEMVQDRLQEPDCAEGALLDGFPRSLAQSEFLDRMLAERGQRVDRVVSLVVPDEEVVSRMGGRRTCLSCGATYHVRFSPPKVEGVCDRCGQPLVQRPDDREDTVRARLATYHRQTSPIVEHYRQGGVVLDVDGVGSIDAISEAIARGIEAVRR